MHKPHVIALFCWCWYGRVLKCCFAKGCALLNLNCQCIHILGEEQVNEASIRCLFACGIVDSSRFCSNCLWSMSCAFKTCAILKIEIFMFFWCLTPKSVFCPTQLWLRDLIDACFHDFAPCNPPTQLQGNSWPSLRLDSTSLEPCRDSMKSFKLRLEESNKTCTHPPGN